MQADISAAIAARYQDLNIEWNVDVTAYPSIVSLFEEAMRNFADLPVCSSLGHALTYQELTGCQLILPAGCRSTPGLQRAIVWRFRCLT